SVGELVAFNILAGRVSAPVLRLAQIWQDFHQARISVARLGDILNAPAETTINTSRAALPEIRGQVTFEHVTFRYRIDGAEVLHENLLFNRSVRANIALTDPSTSMQRIVAAARLAGAHDFILELPEGYDSIVGERGSSLSGGQRQRIAIARALITNPRIIIFDEATSALDYESERVVQQNMAQIACGRTVFVIAHRLSTVRN